MSAYAILEEKFDRIADVNGVLALLEWDSQVMMPPGSMPVRSRQLETLSAIAHAALIDPALPELAARAADETLAPWQQRNLFLMRRHIDDATALPADLVTALARARTESDSLWKDARANDDFKSILPHFTGLLGLIRETAAARGAFFGLSPYDAMLDSHQPGLRADYFAPVFADLSAFLPGFAAQVIERQAGMPGIHPLSHAVPADIQKQLNHDLVAATGFDFAYGRLDVSAHPFCGGVPGDIRLTTRAAGDNFLQSVMDTLHETGHALYEMHLPAEWNGKSIGGNGGMMLHESQSLIMEMQAAHTRQFAAFLARQLAAASNRPCAAEDVYRTMTRVERSFIRVDADEVTYPLHVILRTRLEQALLSGDLPPADLPGAFNDGLRDLLGIVPPSDTVGCLQDPHWYWGMVGYFPTYTLGAMLAAQFFAAATAAQPEIFTELEQGSFGALQGWLTRNVQGKASSVDAPALIVEATGKPLDVAVFKAHLQHRYMDN